MKRQPKMFRKKRADGKHVGSWRVSINGTEVNLGTSDGVEAEKRLKQAMRGKRHFGDELEEAAAAVDGHEPPPAAPPPLTTPPAPQAASPPIVPDAVLPPPAPLQLPPAPSSDEARADAQATNEAADDVAGGAGPANDNAGGPSVDPDVLDQFLLQGAELLVDAQLGLQAAIIKRRTGKIAGAIPRDSPIRGAAAQAWVVQLKIWFPSNVMLPPWAMALIIPCLCIPQQVVTSTQPPEESGAEPVQAAA